MANNTGVYICTGCDIGAAVDAEGRWIGSGLQTDVAQQCLLVGNFLSISFVRQHEGLEALFETIVDYVPVPSGDPEPSQDDISLTQRLTEAGSVLGVRVHDHVVFGDGKFTSLKDRGLM